MITLFSLLIVAAYVVISIAVIVFVGKKKSAKAAGIVAGVLFLLGTWDVILGRAALWYSCEFERVDIRPVEKIVLPEVLFDKRGYVIWSQLKKETHYALEYKSAVVLNWLGLKESRALVLDRTANRLIAENTSFSVSPGWLERFVNPYMGVCIENGSNLDSVFTSGGSRK